ncbi:MAG: hypothetical protein EZS28_024154, partial [Streblomastix strix]
RVVKKKGNKKANPQEKAGNVSRSAKIQFELADIDASQNPIFPYFVDYSKLIFNGAIEVLDSISVQVKQIERDGKRKQKEEQEQVKEKEKDDNQANEQIELSSQSTSELKDAQRQDIINSLEKSMICTLARSLVEVCCMLGRKSGIASAIFVSDIARLLNRYDRTISVIIGDMEVKENLNEGKQSIFSLKAKANSKLNEQSETLRHKVIKEEISIFQYIAQSQKKEQPIRIETKHPHMDGESWVKPISVPGAIGYSIHFSPKCKTHNTNCCLSIHEPQQNSISSGSLQPGKQLFTYSRTGFPKSDLKIDLPAIVFKFNSDGYIEWGVEIDIEPIISSFTQQKQPQWYIEFAHNLALISTELAQNAVLASSIGNNKRNSNKQSLSIEDVQFGDGWGIVEAIEIADQQRSTKIQLDLTKEEQERKKQANKRKNKRKDTDSIPTGQSGSLQQSPNLWSPYIKDQEKQSSQLTSPQQALHKTQGLSTTNKIIVTSLLLSPLQSVYSNEYQNQTSKMDSQSIPSAQNSAKLSIHEENDIEKSSSLTVQNDLIASGGNRTGSVDNLEGLVIHNRIRLRPELETWEGSCVRSKSLLNESDHGLVSLLFPYGIDELLTELKRDLLFSDNNEQKQEQYELDKGDIKKARQQRIKRNQDEGLINQRDLDVSISLNIDDWDIIHCLDNKLVTMKNRENALVQIQMQQTKNEDETSQMKHLIWSFIWYDTNAYHFIRWLKTKGWLMVQKRNEQIVERIISSFLAVALIASPSTAVRAVKFVQNIVTQQIQRDETDNLKTKEQENQTSKQDQDEQIKIEREIKKLWDYCKSSTSQLLFSAQSRGRFSIVCYCEEIVRRASLLALSITERRNKYYSQYNKSQKINSQQDKTLPQLAIEFCRTVSSVQLIRTSLFRQTCERIREAGIKGIIQVFSSLDTNQSDKLNNIEDEIQKNTDVYSTPKLHISEIELMKGIGNVWSAGSLCDNNTALITGLGGNATIIARNADEQLFLRVISSAYNKINKFKDMLNSTIGSTDDLHKETNNEMLIFEMWGILALLSALCQKPGYLKKQKKQDIQNDQEVTNEITVDQNDLDQLDKVIKVKEIGVDEQIMKVIEDILLIDDSIKNINDYDINLIQETSKDSINNENMINLANLATPSYFSRVSNSAVMNQLKQQIKFAGFYLFRTTFLNEFDLDEEIEEFNEDQQKQQLSSVKQQLLQFLHKYLQIASNELEADIMRSISQHTLQAI